MTDSGSTVTDVSTGVETDDRLDAEYDERVREVVAALLAQVDKQAGSPLVETLEAVHRDTGAARSIVRDALVEVLYSGDVTLTEDRRLLRRTG